VLFSLFVEELNKFENGKEIFRFFRPGLIENAIKKWKTTG